MDFSPLRIYARFLSRNKVYTFVSVVGFAVSLAFVILLAVFAKVQISMDDFHENKDRIYMLRHGGSVGHANPVGDYVMNLCPEVESYTRVSGHEADIGTGPQDMYSGRIMLADRDFFHIFSFPLLRGQKDEVLATTRSAVLSQSTSHKLFPGLDPIGRIIVVAEQEITVTGIMEDFPYDTHFFPPEIIVSYDLLEIFYGGDWIWDWYNAGFDIYFLEREHSGFPFKKDLLLGKFREDYWIYQEGFSDDLDFLKLEDVYFTPVNYRSAATKQGSLTKTWIYMGLALTILLIALLNYINMTMAQAGFRGREAAVKKLLGSSRQRIIMQLMGESLLMTTVSLALAFALAFLLEPLFDRLLVTELNLKNAFGTANIGFIILSLLLVSAAAAVLPAFTVASFRPVDVVKGTITRRIKTGYSKWLIIFQFAVCIGLLFSTITMRQQAKYMENEDMGFNRENIMVMRNVVPVESLQAVKEKLLQIPGVEAIGYASGSPLDGGDDRSFTHHGQPYSLRIVYGDKDMRRIFGLDLERTLPSEHGDQDNYIYVNRMAFNALNPDSETGYFDGAPENWHIAGIIGDFNMWSLHKPMVPVAFIPLPDWWVKDIVISLSSDNIYETGENIREAYSELNGGKLFGWYFADDRIHSWYEDERRMSAVMGTFTVLSVVIMVMGVFAMSLYMIRQKEKEIGIRKVNGATVGDMLRMLNLQSLARVGVAFVVACPVAYYGMSKWLQTFAYRIEISLWPFIFSGLVVGALCLVSVSWQTWRAARANPVESLKSE